MAISILTESERKVYESLTETTRAKFAAALKKSGLPEITASILTEVERLRKQNTEIHETQKQGNSMLKTVMSIFKFGGKEAERHKSKYAIMHLRYCCVRDINFS